MSVTLGAHPRVVPVAARAAAGAAPATAPSASTATSGGAGGAGGASRAAPVIVEVRAFVIGDRSSGEKGSEERAGGGADCHSQAQGHWIVDTPIANPMSVYAEYKASRRSWGINALGTVVVEVELGDGTVGVGISIGGEPACYIVEHHLARFVEGQDPRNVELVRHARRGPRLRAPARRAFRKPMRGSPLVNR